MIHNFLIKYENIAPPPNKKNMFIFCWTDTATKWNIADTLHCIGKVTENVNRNVDKLLSKNFKPLRMSRWELVKTGQFPAPSVNPPLESCLNLTHELLLKPRLPQRLH